MMVERYFTEIVKLILRMTFAGSILSIFLFAIKPVIKNKLCAGTSGYGQAESKTGC